MLFPLLFTTFLSLRTYALPTTPKAEVSTTSLAPRDNWDVNRNDLANGICAEVTVIFARGTLELGNVGALAGPQFFNALGNMVAISVAVQGVNYAANIAGFLEGGDPAGAVTAASLINQVVNRCPGTKIVLSGYSQGAQVIHLAIKQISAAVASHVKAVVFFGDPDQGQTLQNISADEGVTYCFAEDLICDGLPIVLPAHLNYAVDAILAAQFVVAHL